MQKHYRHSIRLKGHDYTQPGAYFVTIVTWQRESLFGEIANGQMRLNEFGYVVAEEWSKTPEVRGELCLDEWVIMPNHVHGIVLIVETDEAEAHDVGAHGRAPLRKPRSLGAFVAGIKSITTKRINALRATPGAPVWQRNYYDHIVRDNADLERIREYILHNPCKWELDGENPVCHPRKI